MSECKNCEELSKEIYYLREEVKANKERIRELKADVHGYRDLYIEEKGKWKQNE